MKSADAVLAARQRKYEDAKGTPQEQVDIAQARFDTAKTEKAAAEKALVDARSLHDRLFSQSSNLRKSVDQAQARFDVVNRNYQQKKRKTITTPRIPTTTQKPTSAIKLLLSQIHSLT